jgi:hypothetical protein
MFDRLARLTSSGPRIAASASCADRKIAYALCAPPDICRNTRFVFDKYLLGVYFNARMNRLLYPHWQTVVFVDYRVKKQHRAYFADLEKLGSNLAVVATDSHRPLWELVLSRVRPLFDASTTHVLCRDLDSITTYREAQAVDEWIDSGLACHAIADNVYHTAPLMAGMCAFDVTQCRQLLEEYESFEHLVDGFNLERRGSDQWLLGMRVWPKCRTRALVHCLAGRARTDAAVVKTQIRPDPVRDVRPELSESNLVAAFIGQAGINELELLRFFHRHDEQRRFYEFEDEHRNICYWRR